MMTFGSLFAGIGGIDLGLERAGMVVRWQVEIDEFATRVLEHRWPAVARHTNVRAVGTHNLEPVDLVAGGFPCQDISAAGKGAGITGERSGLWFEFLRIVQELRPRWVLAENVPALRTRGADVVLGGLEAEGYACTPLVVGARHVGAPHRRDRVWIVAHRESIGREGEGNGRNAGPWARCDGAGGIAGVGLADASGDTLRHVEQRMPARRPGGVRDEGQAVARGDGAIVGVGQADSDGRRCEGERLAHGTGLGRSPGHEPHGCGSARACHWPARPGEQQHEWEAPRTVEPSLGSAAHGLSGRLAGRHRRAALKALGNSVVPQVVEEIGRAILASSI